MISYNPNTPIMLVLSERMLFIDNLLRILSRVCPKKLYLYVATQNNYDLRFIDSLKCNISWPCSLKVKKDTKSIDYNQILISANRWFFKYESEGIVLNVYEYWGCVPTFSFFGFCSELLEKYRYDERIGHISCGRILRGCSSEGASYTFSRIPDTSFYATWRRVWFNFDSQMKSFQSFKHNNLIENINIYREYSYFWNDVATINDLQWTMRYEYMQMINNRLSILPSVPLIKSPNQQKIEPDNLTTLVHPRFIIEDTNSALKSREQQLGIPCMHMFDNNGGSFVQERLTSLAQIAGRHLTIPKIIHHVCDYPDGIPQNLLELSTTWKLYHPEWEQRFWNKVQMAKFIQEVCPDFEECFHAFPYDIQRWDAIRYLILYHIGGMYVDLDYECLRPFDSILYGLNCCVATEPSLHAKYNGVEVMLSNALMASVPGDKFMWQVIEMLKNQNSSVFAHLETYKIVLNTTGPLMLTRMYESLKHKENITLLPDELFMPLTPNEIALATEDKATKFIDYKLDNAFAVHYFLGSW